MDFDKHARATLASYYLAHKRWKDTLPSDVTAKQAARDARALEHSKLIAVGELLTQTKFRESDNELAEAVEKYQKAE